MPSAQGEAAPPLSRCVKSASAWRGQGAHGMQTQCQALVKCRAHGRLESRARLQTLIEDGSGRGLAPVATAEVTRRVPSRTGQVDPRLLLAS
jgi:hypothetical protein